MKHENIIQVLYDLALVTSGEINVEPLITKTLQRLLYHTSFPCGVFLSTNGLKKNTTEERCIEQIIGQGNLLKNKGNILNLPRELLDTKGGLIKDLDFLQEVFGNSLKYKIALVLSVNDHEQFILFADSLPASDIHFERVFEPVLNNFGKSLGLCRENERNTLSLERMVIERTELEYSLREAQILLNNVLNTVPSRVYWKDKNLVYLGCNDLYAKDVGLEVSGDIVGKTDFELPWSATEAGRHQADDKTIINSKVSKINIEIEQTMYDQSKFWIEVSKIPLKNSFDEVIGILGAYTDISVRKAMEADLKASEVIHRMIFETTVDGIINIDSKGIIVSVNPAIEKLFKYTSDELIGNNIKLLMSESIACLHDGFLNHYSVTGETTILGHDRELIAKKKDGTLFPIDMAVERMLINGRYLFTSSIRDATVRKESLNKVLKSKDFAERANKSKSNFLSGMTHELRTPLNAILGFGQLIELEESLPSDVKEYTHQIINAGKHLLGLITELLDLAKIESGHVDLFIETVEYDSLIFECMSLIEPIALQHEVHIKHTKNTESSEYILINADRKRIKQVIVNLLSNAIKYNKKAGEVNISINPSNDCLYRIDIQDTGIGISEENLPYVFDSYNRLDAENTAVEGTGIGLVITKNIVELMGGSIGVISEHGIGSTFWFEIPKAVNLDANEVEGLCSNED